MASSQFLYTTPLLVTANDLGAGYRDNDGVERNLVTSAINPVTGGITLISKLTQAEYDALAVKDASTLYVIVAA